MGRVAKGRKRRATEGREGRVAEGYGRRKGVKRESFSEPTRSTGIVMSNPVERIPDGALAENVSPFVIYCVTVRLAFSSSDTVVLATERPSGL